jgi:hypothetical protein
MKKEIVLFSNYLEDYMDEEEAKELLAENGNENPTADEIWYFAEEQKQYELDCFMEEFKWYLDKYTFIATGTCGLWYGRVAGGKVVNGINDFYSLIKDCDFIKITDNNGHLMVKASHHDGNNYYELRKLNDKGVEYHYNKADSLDRKELCERLFTSNYSKLPRLAKELYGC